MIINYQLLHMYRLIKFLGFSLLTGSFLFGHAELEPLVVVEKLTPQPLSEVSPWVTRISSEDLKDSQIHSLSDVLNTVPGMAVVRTGQMGSQTSLFSRGAQSDHTTFLYEGRKLNGGFSGTYNLGQFSLNGVSSIEVLRGSSSVQYGAEGIGGAVMLRSEPKKPQLNWLIEGGSNDSFLKKIDYGFYESGWMGSVSTSLLTTDNEQPNANYHNNSGSFHISRQVSQNLEVDILGLANKSDINYPGNVKNVAYPILDQYQNIEEFLISPGLKLQIGNWNLKSFYTYSEDDLIGKDSFSDTAYEANSQSIDFQINGELNENLEIILGGTYAEDTFYKKENSTDIVDIEKKADSVSTFAFSNYSFGEDLLLSLGARYDDFSDYGDVSTWSSILEKDLFDGFTLITRYSKSFSPPQANDLYGVWGNPELKPEKADSWEVGLIANPNDNLNLYFSYFDTRFKNLIEWSGVRTSNVGTARSRGFESSLKLNQGNYESSFSFAYLDAINSSSNERLLRRPRILGNTELKYSTQIHTFGLGVRYLHDVRDIDGATFSIIEGDDYVVLRLFADFQLTNVIKLFGRVENLMDEDYEEADGYPALGRTIFAGLGFQF